ncbi:MAG: nucleoside hydrolase [Ruminococcaceae bacterium]|nr:nucleoside hydrolase [Oscillospiraceae bacterium]
MEKKRKVIFDCDVGTDDAVALTAMLFSEGFEVVGITTVHGNHPVEFTTENTLRLLEFLGKDIPVYKGCNESMTRGLLGENNAVRMEQIVKVDEKGNNVYIHEREIGFLPKAKTKAMDKHACSFIVDYLRSSKEKVTVVAVGPLTNIGIALRMAPEIAEKIEEMYIMGGALYVGNRTPVAEANFYDDPHAAQIVLRSGIKTIICPLEPSIAAKYGPDEFAALVDANPKVGGFLARLNNEMIDRLKFLGILGQEADSTGIWDWTAVAPLIDPSVVADMRRETVDVELARGFSEGMLVFDRRGFDQLPEEEEKNHIIYEINPERLISLLEELIREK